MDSQDSSKNAGKPSYVVAGHEVLFDVPAASPRSDSDADRCDACGAPIEASATDTDTDDGYAIAGRGRYLWTRGEEHRSEEPPLCPSCAAAIGMVALQHLNMEEDEG